VLGYFPNVGGGQTEFVALLDTKLSHLDVFVDSKTRMFQSLLRAPDGTTINGDQHFACLGRFDHPTDMAPNTCKTKVPASTLLSQPYGSLISDLPHIRAAGTTEY